jgi:hypothetical protein
MKMFAAVLALAVVTACGDSPTRPTTTSSTVQASASQSAPPASDPAPPSDSPPPPPTPVPTTPTPTPVPDPQPDLRLSATTDGNSWPDPAQALPSTFDVVVWPDRVEVGLWTLKRDTSTPEHLGILASDSRGTFTLQRGQLAGQWTWRFVGPIGYAGGTAQER